MNATITPIFGQNNNFSFDMSLNANGVNTTVNPVINAELVTSVKPNPTVCNTKPPPNSKPNIAPVFQVFVPMSFIYLWKNISTNDRAMVNLKTT